MGHHPDALKIGQFSESPVLAVAKSLGLDEKYGVQWETSRVPSSPAQFASLRDGEIDLAITSPDNVLLYATTPENPLGEQLGIRLLRPIDHGLGLSLFTAAEVSTVEELSRAHLGVDVMSSGFALLLLSMLRHLGVDPSGVTFEAKGATPLRVKAIGEGEIHGSILNAESAVKAQAMGLRRWATSADVNESYLGTVLVQLAGPVSPAVTSFLALWEESTQTILHSTPHEVIDLLATNAPALADADYVELLQSTQLGLISGDTINPDDLRTLAQIRRDAGTYAPSDRDILTLVESNDSA